MKFPRKIHQFCRLFYRAQSLCDLVLMYKSYEGLKTDSPHSSKNHQFPFQIVSVGSVIPTCLTLEQHPFTSIQIHVGTSVEIIPLAFMPAKICVQYSNLSSTIQNQWDNAKKIKLLIRFYRDIFHSLNIKVGAAAFLPTLRSFSAKESVSFQLFDTSSCLDSPAHSLEVAISWLSEWRFHLFTFAVILQQLC